VLQQLLEFGEFAAIAGGDDDAHGLPRSGRSAVKRLAVGSQLNIQPWNLLRLFS
jgi:uncharacterized cupin superfamily protein